MSSDASQTSTMSAPKAVGLCVMVIAVASIVFVSQTQTEMPDFTSRFLKGEAEETIPYNKVPKVQYSKAPLFMQDASEKHPVQLLMAKYGMGTKQSGKKAAKHPEKSEPVGPMVDRQKAQAKAEKKAAKKSSSSSVMKSTGKGEETPRGVIQQKMALDGVDVSEVDTEATSTWIYARVLSTTDCGAKEAVVKEYMTGGMKADTCVSIQGGTSMKATCNAKGVSVYNYGSNNCMGTPTTSELMATIGCQIPNGTPWGANMSTDDNYSDSIEVRVCCVGQGRIPL